jgi:surfeit locus 1 family protein
MASVHNYDSTPGWREQLAAWQQLPRLLISRRWRWMTLVVIATTAWLISLGFWQLDRLEQRRAMNTLISSRLAAPPIELTGQPLDLAEYEYRRVIVRGSYDPAQEVVLRNQVRGGRPGYDLLTPLRIDGSEQAVLVDRGWVPLQQATPAARQAFVVEGPVTVEGIIRKPIARTSSIGPVDRIPEGGRLDAWFRPDVAQIAQQVPYPLLPFYVAQNPTPRSAELPDPQQRIQLTEGSHLSYAIQWFAFATILVCGWAAFVVTRSNERSGRAAG